MKLRRRWARRAGGHDMTCREAVALVTAYLDGVLGSSDQNRFEDHLDECPHCREHLEQIRATILVAGQVRPEDLAPDVRAGLMDLYRRWHGEQESD